MKNKPFSFKSINIRRFSEKEKAKEKVGQAPGTLLYTGKKHTEKVVLELIAYNLSELEQKEVKSVDEIPFESNNDKVFWLNVAGLHDIKIIQLVGEKFQLHPLLLEDVLHVDQRPKMEDFGSHIFFTIKMFHSLSEKGIEYEHLSFVLGDHWVVSFQEMPQDQFDILRERLSTAYGKIREKGADYLFYRFIDIIIDHYFLIIDQVTEKIELIEADVLQKPNRETLDKLQYSRKEIIHLRKSIFPLRESILSVVKSESKLVSEENNRYLQDAYDHCIQVIESLDTQREILNGIMDLYMNQSGHRMNEIMKVLTIMSTIFIPLTFIAGIYGMNFEHMPELQQKWAYPLTLLFMLLIALIMLFIFKRKKWF